MNVLSQIGKQLSELFNSLTPSARIMAGLMVGVIVVSLGWIVSTESSGDYESLLGGYAFTNVELDRIEVAFGDAQLRDFKRLGRQIMIPKGAKDLYLKALSSANALPKESGSEINRALQDGNVFESTEKFIARMQTAQERELANTLMRMRGIEFAAVRYDTQRTGFGRQAEQVCSIRLQGPLNEPIPDAVLKSIAAHASKCFAGLKPENISVLDLSNANIFNASDDPLSASANPMLTAKKEWEQYLDQKVGAILKAYGAVELMVNVEIDPTLIEQEEKLTYNPTAVTVQSTESRKDTTNSKSAPGGPPGSDINGIGNKPQSISSTAAGQSSTTKESEANERRLAGHEAIRKETAALTPTKISISIGVPESHYREVFAHRFLRNNPDKKPEDVPAPSAQELADVQAEREAAIRSAVEGLTIGVRAGDDPKPSVNVYAYPDLPMPEFPEPSLAANTMVWLGQSWSTLALIVLVLVSLGMMFSWVKSQGSGDTDTKFADGFGLEVPVNMGDELDIGGSEEGDGPGSTRSKPQFDVSGSEMKEDLSTLIKDNPDAVVNLLKAWIGEAA